MSSLELRCRCGQVELLAENVSPRLGNRVICYCESCQQFPIKLGCGELLDEYGGTDIYQLPPAHLRILKGKEHVRCLKHSEKGLLRFYAGCCNTPIANAPGLRFPFVGLILFMDTEPASREQRIGRVQAHVNTDGAVKPLPADRRGGVFSAIVRLLSRMVLWRVQGKVQPHPFYDDNGRAIAKPEVR